MLRKTNLLVLDEPTNDLDLSTLTVLEDCLADFPGGVLLVTHDRYFLDRVSTQLLGFAEEAPGRGTVTMLAGLDQWETWREEQNALAASRVVKERPPQKGSARKRRVGYLEQRELDGMEEKILAAEASRDALKAQTEHPDNVSDAPKLVELLRLIEEKQSEIDRLYARWSELEALASDPS
jgi:ATP-binding cassette subfamily F protein uup